MLEFDLIKNVLITALATSIITTAFVQKIKETFTFKKSNRLVLVSFISSMLLGTLFSLTFSNNSFTNSLWIGLFSFLGADTLYKSFEDKIFKSFKNIHSSDVVEVPKENIIK